MRRDPQQRIATEIFHVEEICPCVRALTGVLEGPHRNPGNFFVTQSLIMSYIYFVIVTAGRSGRDGDATSAVHDIPDERRNCSFCDVRRTIPRLWTISEVTSEWTVRMGWRGC